MEAGHPTVGQGQVPRTVYFQGYRNTKEWSTTVKVVNCGQFYVYHLTDLLEWAMSIVGFRDSCLSDGYS